MGGIHSVYCEEIAASNFSRKERERSSELSLVSVTESIFVFLSHSSTQAVKHRLHLWSELLMPSLYNVMGISRPIIFFFCYAVDMTAITLES